MKFLFALAPLALTGCGIIPIGGYASYYAPSPEPTAYCPPPPLEHFSTWTPGSPRPFRYYNYGPAGGSSYTPGVTNALHPFTYFNP